jgi:glucosamine--fructose-6-phosphate aminotransferase (isomerizing)
MLKVPVQAVTALAFSRYAVELAPSDALVVALSQSGKVSRVVEAARLARQRGVYTIAVTGSGSSPLSSEGDSQIVSPFPKLGAIPGTASYVFNLALFFELGAALADAWQTHADTDRVRSQLASLPQLIDRSSPAVWTVAGAHAAETARRGLVHVALGSGPNLATARFFARKACEIPQVAVVAQDSEEFAHEQYSLVEAGSPVLMCSPPGAAADRDDELLVSLGNLKAAVAVITDETRTFPERGTPTWRYDLATGLDELLTPLLYSLPAQVFSYEIAKRVGGSFYAFADETHRRDGDPLIYESAMVERASSH